MQRYTMVAVPNMSAHAQKLAKKNSTHSFCKLKSAAIATERWNYMNKSPVAAATTKRWNHANNSPDLKPERRGTFSLPHLVKPAALNVLSVLIVDDSKAYTLKLKKMLNKVILELNMNSSIKILSTTNVFSALHVLSNYRFSLVLVDNIFANASMTGSELCCRLQARTTLKIKMSPLVVMSGQKTVVDTNIHEKHLLNPTELKKVLQKYATPMTSFDAMHAITNSMNLLSSTTKTLITGKTIKVEEEEMEPIDNQAETRFDMFNPPFISSFVVRHKRGYSDRKREAEMYEKLVWQESEPCMMLKKREISTMEKKINHRRRQRTAKQIAKRRDDILKIMNKKKMAVVSYDLPDVSSDDEDNDGMEKKEEKNDKVLKEEKIVQNNINIVLLPSLLSYVDQLCTAIRNNNIPNLQTLMAIKGTSGCNDINGTNEHGLTALHVAAGLGRHEMIAVLIQEKADVNAAPNGYTPYAHALNSVTKGIGATQQTLDLLHLNGAKLSEESKVEQMKQIILKEQKSSFQQQKRRSSMRSRRRSSMKSGLGRRCSMRSGLGRRSSMRSGLRNSQTIVEQDEEQPVVVGGYSYCTERIGIV
jgi:CheY-like chemotaxis protein